MPIGLAKYMYSEYQRGLTGIDRVERIGTFLDKIYTMQLLTLRTWQTDYTLDVPFFTNFYDLFPVEMQQLWNGMIRGNPEVYMPRLRCAEGSTFPRCNEPHVVYMDFYRGDCSEGSTTCRPDPAKETYAGLPVLSGGNFILLQIYATIFGLSEFPVFFDTTFQNQLFICVEGQGDCHRPSPDAVEGVDYVRFTSDRFGKSWLAWQVEPTASVANQASIGFDMIKEARDQSIILRALRKYRGDSGGTPYSTANLTAGELAELDAIGYELNTSPSATEETDLEIDRVDGRVGDLESFFNQVRQLQLEMGITDYLGFGG
jgi:hypothetical protein